VTGAVLGFPPPAKHTKRFRDLSTTDIYAEEVLLVAKSASETRGQLPVWETLRQNDPAKVLQIELIDREHIAVHRHDEELQTICLVDEGSLQGLVATSRVLIDISGFPHNVWAPILKAAYHQKPLTRIVYAEPESYKSHPTPASATLFDLSVSLEGLAPLPGFAQLEGPEEEDKTIYVPLLGFEGNRPERLAMQLDPTPKVLPIVGVPGFQLEYPAFTVACNRGLLEEYRAHANIRLARASCPFEVFDVLGDIRKDYPDHYMYIAPVGTKPHSLGGVLYAIANPHDTEIMFDYPIRKSGRTSGVGVIHIYDFGKFEDV
tara:strand:- start:46901 stop:47854 length:954 start_codon:yes stop_codon:yes gene_type:complete